jgi:alpha-soluble NSF attachment protein
MHNPSHFEVSQAAQTLERAAQLQTEIGEVDDAANSLVQASQCYQAKPDAGPEDAAAAGRLLKGAITHYTVKGNFRRAASYEEKLADIYEKSGDLAAATEAYDQAGQWYKIEGSVQMANKMFLKVADNAASIGDYHKAIDKFEEVAKASASNNLMKWSLKEYFFKAAICHLCTGVSCRLLSWRYEEGALMSGVVGYWDDKTGAGELCAD